MVTMFEFPHRIQGRFSRPHPEAEITAHVDAVKNSRDSDPLSIRSETIPLKPSPYDSRSGLRANGGMIGGYGTTSSRR